MNAASNPQIQGKTIHQHSCGNLSYLLGGIGSVKRAMERGELPAPGERAVVRCIGFQCLAYRDSNGRWREASDKRLIEVLEIVFRL